VTPFGGAVLALALVLGSNAAHAGDKALQPLAIVQTIDEGCVAGGEGEGKDGVEWVGEQQAVYRLNLWLNSRERIQEGPVEVDVSPGKVVAYVSVQVTEPAAGEPVATCIRPVQLHLSVSPIERGNYDWQFRRGTRAEVAALEAAARAEASGLAKPGSNATPEATAGGE
jgi:hypothetical protein